MVRLRIICGCYEIGSPIKRHLSRKKYPLTPKYRNGVRHWVELWLGNPVLTTTNRSFFVPQQIPLQLGWAQMETLKNGHGWARPQNLNLEGKGTRDAKATSRDCPRWDLSHNHERPHRGYSNQGRRPYETFIQGKKSITKGQKAQEVKSDKVA